MSTAESGRTLYDDGASLRKMQSDETVRVPHQPLDKEDGLEVREVRGVRGGHCDEVCVHRGEIRRDIAMSGLRRGMPGRS